MSSYDQLFEEACQKTVWTLNHGDPVEHVCIPLRDGRHFGDTLHLHRIARTPDNIMNTARDLNRHFLRARIDGYIVIGMAHLVQIKISVQGGEPKSKVCDPQDILQATLFTKDYTHNRQYSTAEGKVIAIWEDVDTRTLGEDVEVKMTGPWWNLLDPHWEQTMSEALEQFRPDDKPEFG